MSRGSHSQPVSPSSISSGNPNTLVASTGVSNAIASSTVRGSDSMSEAQTSRSASWYQGWTSGVTEISSIRSPKSIASTKSASASESGSSRAPTKTSRARGCARAIESKACASCSCAFRGSIVPTQRTTSASSEMPASRRAAARSKPARAASIGAKSRP